MSIREPNAAPDGTLYIARIMSFHPATLDAVDPESQPGGAGALVDALCRGEPAAARMVWRCHAPTVFRVMRRMLGSSADVEDIVQRTFVVFFERVETLREPSALESFLLGIAVNTARKEIRRRTALRWLRLLPPDELPPIAVVDDVDGREALRRLDDVLDALDCVSRAIFVLRRIEGRELVDVAGITGLSLATVKRKLVRADARVGKLMEGDPVLRPYAPAGEGDSA
jgi:RNA polymerase sigma-70 factor (ECF subfamily)